MKRHLYFFLLLLFLSTACQQTNKNEAVVLNPQQMAANFQLIDSLKSAIQSGDIIFRNGNDEVSHVARSMSRKDTSFSHCGIIINENDSIYVYHAIGGSYNPSQRLKKELLDSFCNPAENNAIGIYRYQLEPQALNKLVVVVKKYYAAGLKFDMYFNFKSDDAMYCSEFVFKSLNQSMDGAYSKYVRLDTFPYGITTDDIFLNENCRMLKKQQFYK